jgi:hypothetical protein
LATKDALGDAGTGERFATNWSAGAHSGFRLLSLVRRGMLA